MHQKGVTLIELVVVFVIVAILGLLIVPNIGAWIPNYRLRSATRDIVSTMRTAQMRAISSNMQYRVNFNADEIEAVNSYVLQRDSGSGHFLNEGPIQTLPAGITITINLPDDKALFNPNSTSSSGSVTLKSQKKNIQKSITLTASTGRVKIVD